LSGRDVLAVVACTYNPASRHRSYELLASSLYWLLNLVPHRSTCLKLPAAT
jgi:hypothetical protein